jgi:hypothetical protein
MTVLKLNSLGDVYFFVLLFWYFDDYDDDSVFIATSTSFLKHSAPVRFKMFFV